MTKEYVETIDSLRRRSENAENTVLEQFKEIQRLREAIKPFAEWAESIDAANVDPGAWPHVAYNPPLTQENVVRLLLVYR